MGRPVLLLSPFYFGSVQHYAAIARSGQVLLDAGGHYERQSYRTRTSIVGANGVQSLDVHIARRSGEKMPLHSVGLSYAEPWHHQHLHAIRSAYGRSPWFIHYVEDLEGLLRRRSTDLLELDLATLRLCLAWLGLDPMIEVRTDYVEIEEVTARGMIDLRSTLHPKRPLPAVIPEVPAYPQVFADRHGSHRRLSIIDLVMNTGPDALATLLGNLKVESGNRKQEG